MKKVFWERGLLSPQEKYHALIFINKTIYFMGKKKELKNTKVLIWMYNK